GPCAVRDFTMEWHYMERFGKSSFNGSRNIGQRLVQNDAFERLAPIVPGGAAEPAGRLGLNRLPQQANGPPGGNRNPWCGFHCPSEVPAVARRACASSNHTRLDPSRPDPCGRPRGSI